MSEKTFKVPFDDAVKYIDAFVTNFKNVAVNEALGGTLLKSRIDGSKKFDTQYRGNMAWYCYNPDAERPLFMSFEESNEYEDSREVDKPDLNQLRRPSDDSIFKYTDEYKDIATMVKNAKTSNRRSS